MQGPGGWQAYSASLERILETRLTGPGCTSTVAEPCGKAQLTLIGLLRSVTNRGCHLQGEWNLWERTTKERESRGDCGE